MFGVGKLCVMWWHTKWSGFRFTLHKPRLWHKFISFDWSYGAYGKPFRHRQYHIGNRATSVEAS